MAKSDYVETGVGWRVDRMRMWRRKVGNGVPQRFGVDLRKDGVCTVV